MSDKPFDALEYTRSSLAEELGLIERHSTDGSAFEAGCSCIEEKHLLLISGLAREGTMLASDAEEKKFYGKLGEAARELRKTIVDGDFKFPENPFGRAYLPHGLTEEERESASLKRKLSRCIREVEEKQCPRGFKDYSECSANPVAVCRSSIEK